MTFTPSDIGLSSEAAARLKEAQAQYQAEVEKTKGGSNEKPGSTTKQ